MSRFLLTLVILISFRSSYSAEGKGGMPQLNPESFSSQLFWLLIFFTFLFFIVNSIFIPKIKKIRNIETFELNSLSLRSYYHNNILAFGDLLHRIHPLAGQGFNMTLKSNQLNLRESTEKNSRNCNRIIRSNF